MTTPSEIKSHGRPDQGVTDVVIVSAFGRGNWLASHLSEQDWHVSLVDITPSLGAWEPADWDGPFGLFESDTLLPSQKRQWLQEADTRASGFTIWLSSGPLEGHGALAGFLSSRHDVSPEARAYLQLIGDADDSQFVRERRLLARRSFQESWLAHLAHQVSSNIYQENDRALSAGAAIPFYAPYFLRASHPDLLESGLRVCEARGVTVYRGATVSALEFSGSWPQRQWSTLRLGNGAEIAGHACVWMLASAETEVMTPALRPQLFPKEKLEPSWCWLRFEMSAAVSRVIEATPQSFVVIGDVLLPWTHANLVYVRKQPITAARKSQGLDVWARVPCAFRFSRPYLETLQADIRSLLDFKLPASDVARGPLPLEIRLGADGLPAPRWPVFPIGHDVRALRLKNFSVDGPEQWVGLDPLAQFKSQKKILAALERQKVLRDERSARDELRAQKKAQRRAQRESRQRGPAPRSDQSSTKGDSP